MWLNTAVGGEAQSICIELKKQLRRLAKFHSAGHLNENLDCMAKTEKAITSLCRVDVYG